MRIHHHVSIILLVAIVGAIALAATVGVMIGGVERAARAAGMSAEQYSQVENVVGNGRDLTLSVKSLSSSSTQDTFAALGRDLQRSIVTLARLRYSVLVADKGPVEHAMLALETIARQEQQLKQHGQEGTLTAAELTRFQGGMDLYMRRLDTLRDGAAKTARTFDAQLSSRRRLMMIVVGIICILYLAVIDRLRHWTTRRLVLPVQTLASAAVKSMREDGTFSGFEQGSTEELDTLARVLASFVDTLKTRVRERTAEVEEQKEHLEREVAVRRRAEDQLRHAAFHDKLTGLCNRDLLIDRLERCMDRARRQPEYKFAVLFLDVDRFKEINDRLGHFVGDQLLVAIAERLQTCLRSTDSLSCVESNTVARIGGDEFVVLLDGIEERGDASIVAQRVQDELSAPFRIQEHEVRTTASIGIAFNELESESADYLLRDADTAMYYAKAAGKARHEVFDRKMHDEAKSRVQLHNDLRHAVENEDFKIRYQPIVSLTTGRIYGFEALARWNHPERGEVNPVEFISHAEETGLIVALGRWILQGALQQLKTWTDDGAVDETMVVSVNVSKRQVAERGFVDEVRQVLADVGISGSRLKLEITESVIMENPDSIAEVLQEFKDLGIQVHMDDFGTGYSSLSYLHRFPLDVLKIDRAFISTMSAETDYAVVVETVVALAHTLNMQVVVEGVETEQQLQKLLLLNCDFAQGFYFAKPLVADDARALITSGRTWLKHAA
jgi:diguanylate cyclase (GGDEF)-like protein